MKSQGNCICNIESYLVSELITRLGYIYRMFPNVELHEMSLVRRKIIYLGKIYVGTYIMGLKIVAW